MMYVVGSLLSLPTLIFPLFFDGVVFAAAAAAAAAPSSASAAVGGPCDESFPRFDGSPSLPPPPARDAIPTHGSVRGRRRRARANDYDGSAGGGNGELRRRLVAIPSSGGRQGEYYETGEYYAPLCPDGRRVDVRELYRCNAGSCWMEDIGQCTFECTWSPPTPKPSPTPRPTMKPTISDVVSEHPLLLELENLPDEYAMDPKLLAAFVSYVKQRLDNDLKDLGFGLELLRLDAISATLPGRGDRRGTEILPLRATIKGPEDIADFVMSYLLQTARDARDEYLAALKKLDGESESTKDATLAVDTYSFDDLVWGEAPGPPSVSPTPQPIKAKPMEKKAVQIMEEEVNGGIPWWVWLIIVLLVLLLLCLSCYCCCYRRDSDDAEDKKDDGGRQQQINNVFIENDKQRSNNNNGRSRRVPPPPRSVAAKSRRVVSSRGSVAGESRRTSSRGGGRPPPPRVRRHSPSGGDGESRRTSRTRRTHRTTAPTSRAHRPPASIAIETSAPVIEEEEYEDLESQLSDDQHDAILAIMPPPQAEAAAVDPPEEQMTMIVPYDPNQRGRASTTTSMSIVPSAEPEGDKVDRKKSVIGDALLMNQVRREMKEKEQEQAQNKAQRARKSKTARASGARFNRKSSIDRLKQSIKWRGGAGGRNNGNDVNSDRLTARAAEEPDEERWIEEEDDGRVLSDPEGLTVEEVAAAEATTKKKERKKSSGKNQKKRKSKTKNEGTTKTSSSSRPKVSRTRSFSWEQEELCHNGRVEKEEEEEEDKRGAFVPDDDSDSDSDPSIITRPPPLRNAGLRDDDPPNVRSDGTYDYSTMQQDDGPNVLGDGTYDYSMKQDEGNPPRRPRSSKHHQPSKKKGSRSRGKQKGGLFGSVRRQLSTFVRDGVSSNEESSFSSDMEY